VFAQLKEAVEHGRRILAMQSMRIIDRRSSIVDCRSTDRRLTIADRRIADRRFNRRSSIDNSIDDRQSVNLRSSIGDPLIDDRQSTIDD
jgi:hypothetical protein